jgi:branched-chain amino acid transport system permease protein
MSQLIQSLILGLAIGGVYSLVALGFVLIYKGSGTLNIAQGEVLTLGAMFCYTMVLQLKLPMVLAVLLTLGVSVGFGYFIERTVIRPMIGQPVLAIVMVTIGLGAILRGIISLWMDPTPVSFPMNFPGIRIAIGNILIPSDYLWVLGITMITMIGFVLFFRLSRTGLAMRATADYPMAAQAVGIKAQKIYGASWAMSCVAASIGGIVLGLLTSVHNLLSGVGFKSMSAAVVGGLDSIPGTFIGGLIIGVVEAFTGGYLENYVPGIKEAMPFIILMAILLIKPHGLMGLRQIERV